MSRDHVIDEDGRVIYWPMCPIPGCQNRICLRLDSKYCYPHTGSGKSPEEVMDELRRKPETV